MKDPIRILVVGAGFMGRSHALSYPKLENIEVIGLVTLNQGGRAERLSEKLGGVPCFTDYDKALTETKPDAVSINSYTDSHYKYIKEALKRDMHVFVEKPMTETLAQAEEIVKLARERKRKVVVGYILRHHPVWNKFIDIARGLGGPLIMRMNLNQQGKGVYWQTLKNIMQISSPLVDCGVHYVDVMCQMTGSKPRYVHAIGLRNLDDIPEHLCNYGQLQIEFEDGSVGWYEAGWGPMMSEEAYFIKDVIGRNGSVSISSNKTDSADKNSHVITNHLVVHHAELREDDSFAKEDEFIEMKNEPNHHELCLREQDYFIRAIREDVNLDEHLKDAIDSMRIVLAADESYRTKKVVEL